MNRLSAQATWPGHHSDLGWAPEPSETKFLTYEIRRVSVLELLQWLHGITHIKILFCQVDEVVITFRAEESMVQLSVAHK